MTQILSLPLITLEVASSNDADLRFSVSVMGILSPTTTQDVVAINLTGITFLFRIWRTPSGGHEILLASAPTEITLSANAAGVRNIINVIILAERMAKVPLGEWPFEIIATADGATIQFVTGTLTHSADGGALITSLTSTPRLMVTN